MYTETVAGDDVNNPQLGSYTPDEVDPNAIPVRSFPPPPDEGIHTLVLTLDDRREGGPVYQKDETKVIAAIRARYLNEDGTDGSYLKDWYPTSVVMPRQKASALSGLCYLAGRPYPRGRMSLDEQQAHVERLFAEAPDGKIVVKAETRWVKSYQAVDEVGMPKYDGDRKIYTEIKGKKKIVKMAELEAKAYVATWNIAEFEGFTPEQFQKAKNEYVEAAVNNAHLFQDPVSGEDRQVQTEIVQLVE